MARPQQLLLVCLALAVGLTSGVPRGKNQVNLGPKDLSDETHYHPGEDGEKGEHNVAYDHEAFLGKEEAKRFDEMEPEEARRKLGLIVDKIDKDKDGFVSEQELEDWVRHVAHRHIVKDAERFWSYYDNNGDGAMDWDEYMHHHEGVEDLDAIYDTYRGLSYRQLQQRDQRRFQLTDRDSNGHLNKEEFVYFLHPEEAGPHMRDLVIDETMTSMDKDQDGYISTDEYLKDVGVRYGNDPSAEQSEWVPRERDNFNNWDKDRNKKLDREELGDWIMPKGYNPTLAEAKHLIHAADTDKDKKLTKAEILARQDHFVGSRVTDYGTYHEEL